MLQTADTELLPVRIAFVSGHPRTYHVPRADLVISTGAMASEEDPVAVYLEVVPASAGRGSSQPQTLEGSQCLVFFLGGTSAPRPSHPGGINILMGDGSVRFAKDLDDIAAQLSRAPIGAGMIIIGPAREPGYVTTRWHLKPGSGQLPSLGLTHAGGSVVLIGLLLPAVQAVREAARTKAHSVPVQQLRRLAGGPGRVFVIGGKGELVAL